MSRWSHLVGGGQRFRENDSRVPIPVKPSVRNFSLALGDSHRVVEVLNHTLDKVLSEPEVSEVVERGEKLEVLHEPCFTHKQYSTIDVHEADSLDPSLRLTECAEHFQIPIRQGVLDALL